MNSIKTVIVSLFILGFAGIVCAQTWSFQSSGTDRKLNHINFADNSMGWAFGDTSDAFGNFISGVFLKTTDGGGNWVKATTGFEKYDISSSYFFTSDYGIVAGKYQDSGDGVVLITLNGGLTWTANTSFTERIDDVDFADANNGWIVGRDGTIYSSSNAGSSWTQQTSGTDVELFAVDFTDANIGHISGAETTLLNTYDGGSSWAVADTAGLPKLDYFDIFFINTSTGWTVGEAGTILTSADSGKTWSEQTSGTNVDLFSVSFVDENNGWISGGGGTILYTTDGGSTWNSQLSGSNQDILSISMRTASLGWYCGDNGTIGYYSNFPSSIMDNNAMLNYVTVYPNPVSNKAIIDLSQFSKNESSIALYDLTGSLILQRTQIKGPNITLSNDGITPGVYILKIINNVGQVYTEKIVFN